MQSSPATRGKAQWPRSLLPCLTLYLLLLEATSGFVLPSGAGEGAGLEAGGPRLPVPGTRRDRELHVLQETDSERVRRNTWPSDFNSPLERISVQTHHHDKNNRKRNNSKRRRVSAPVDSIGSSSFSNHRSRQDEPELSWDPDDSDHED
ncbi:hypothetical protein HHUSO_G21662 [Huso huso]|uniref:Uncharacterized protein n=1 Tax=Huso huso TaxID=61971 RepID=A0ABR0YZH5_HUSHU